MDALSPAEIAGAVVADLMRSNPGELGPSLGLELANRLETALRAMVRQERNACVAVCAHRYELWTSTGDRVETPASLRAEARHRSNEAAFLADALRMRAS